MPLIHSKKPKAFSHNVRTEMEAGKPQKQAVAIAYREAGEHKADGGCVGPHCKGCESEHCMAEGGSVRSATKREDNEKGVGHAQWSHAEGMSSAGQHVRAGMDADLFDKEDSLGAAKREHHKTLAELRMMKKPKMMAEGGDVKPPLSYSEPDERERKTEWDEGREEDDEAEGEYPHESEHRNLHESEAKHRAAGNHEKAHEAKEKKMMLEVKHPELKERKYAGGGAVEAQAIQKYKQQHLKNVPPGENAQGHAYNPYKEGGDVLDTHAREHIAKKNFAGPDRSYPIEDKVHARNALARVAQNGSPHLQEEVRAKVHAKYPGIDKEAEGGEIHEDEGKDKELIDDELHGMLGEELMSAIDAKDKKRIMESLEAIVLQCLDKE